jgi:S1-C subfamily serine protease
VSAVASAQMPGVSVVRIAPNSPLANHLKMGDVVTKVNNVAVNHP